MPKMFQFNEVALQSILKGIQILAKAVKVTLGPKGKNVIIKTKDLDLISTKDGALVAKEIILKEKFENMGVQILKEVAFKTAEITGDGTTTAIVLAEEIFKEGLKNIVAFSNPMLIKKGIEKATRIVCGKLDEIANEVRGQEEIKQIATISANNDEEIGSIIADAIKKVGKDGIITTSEAKEIETTLEIVEGMQFSNGFISPYFITNPEKMIVEMENPLIYITEKKLSSAKDIITILEKVMQKEASPLLIIAEDIDSDALTTLVVNKVKANLPICAVKTPYFGDIKKEMLKDIAIITGGQVITDELGIQNEKLELFDFLGKAKKVKVSKEKTTIIEGMGKIEEIKQREKQIKSTIEATTSKYDKEKLEERLAHLVGGVAQINVGAATEVEMKEKRQRIEDALHATKAAVAQGIVPGGGVALLRCSGYLDDIETETKEEQLGIQIIKKACLAPAIEIINNCGKKGDVIAEKILEKKGSWGFNGLSEKFSDLIKDGIIDPVLVTKTAIKNASSIVSLLLTIDVMITDVSEIKKNQGSLENSYSSMGGMPPMGNIPMM